MNTYYVRVAVLLSILFYVAGSAWAEPKNAIPDALLQKSFGGYWYANVLDSQKTNNSEMPSKTFYQANGSSYEKGLCTWGDKNSFLTLGSIERSGGNVCTVRDVTLAWLTNKEGLTFKGAVFWWRGGPAVAVVYKNSF